MPHERTAALAVAKSARMPACHMTPWSGLGSRRRAGGPSACCRAPTRSRTTSRPPTSTPSTAAPTPCTTIRAAPRPPSPRNCGRSPAHPSRPAGHCPMLGTGKDPRIGVFSKLVSFTSMLEQAKHRIMYATQHCGGLLHQSRPARRRGNWYCRRPAGTVWACGWRGRLRSGRARTAARAGHIPPTCTTTCTPSAPSTSQVRAVAPSRPRAEKRGERGRWMQAPSPVISCHPEDSAEGHPSSAFQVWPLLRRVPRVVSAGTDAGNTPVALMPDGPSLGGFVCPATIPSAELWKIGQVGSSRCPCRSSEEHIQRSAQ